jgi:succinate dehydrogenase subunit C
MAGTSAARAAAPAKARQPELVRTHTDYHPRWYRPKVSVYWWLGQRQYLKFIIRELSSVFVATFVVEMLVLFSALAQGPDAYAQFVNAMRSPVLVVLNLVSFFFVVFHTITWFNLTPHAMQVNVAGRRVPGIALTAPNYIGWLVLSIVIAWALWR